MNSRTKRILSTMAIIVASVAFGIIISADVGLMQKSSAQTATIRTTSGPVTSVTVPSFADIAARVAPAVVSITSTEVVKTSSLQHGFGIDPFQFFFPNPNGQRQRPTPNEGGQGDQQEEHAERSGGSGFIISPDGYILTNNHVVEGATKVEVHYGADINGNGGHTVSAKIVGRDPAIDLALLKIDVPQTLATVPLGDSNSIRTGDWAVAIGNPYQFANTLTVGVISAKGRALGLSQETSSFENFIQTDAAINFGNSGGPLLNINGEVVGINTAIRGGGAQGIGFATPINTAKRLLPELKQGKVVRSYLGMGIVPVTDQVREGFNLPPNTQGALVQYVEPDKPAARAGLQPGDVVVEIDGRQITTNRELIDYISYLPVGTKVNVTVIRNGQRRTLSATTMERQPEAGEENNNQNATPEPSRFRLGMSVDNITPDVRQMYGIDDGVRGVVITDVKDVSPAGDVVSQGDVITEIQGQKISNVAEFRAAIDRVHSGETIRLYVITPGRAGVQGYRFIKVP